MKGNRSEQDNEMGLEAAITTLRGMPPDSRKLAVSLIEKLAGAEGLSLQAQYRSPIDNIESWLTKLRAERLSEKTIKLYGYLAARFLREIPEPTRADIREYLARRIEETSPASAETERKALASLFSFLHAEGLWPENPTEGIKNMGLRYGEGERKCPSLEDVDRVLEVGFARSQDADKMKTMVVILALTGLRISELMGLRREDTDLGASELRVLGKGRRRRIVPLVEAARDTLAGYMERHTGDSPFVFPGKTRTGHAHISNIQKTLKRACVRAGVEPFTRHQLRHLYATEMLKKGAKLEVVGRILGHASIGITADIYRHVDTGEMHEEAGRFVPLNGAGPKPEGGGESAL